MTILGCCFQHHHCLLVLGPGLEVEEAIPMAGRSVQKRIFMHTVFLLSVAADSLARQKMALWPGVRAFLACGWCSFEGFSVEGDSATHFNGYAEPAEQVILGLGTCKVGDPQIQISDALHHRRARAVEAGEALPQTSGCNRYSEFPKVLSYVTYSDVWELPIYHAGELS